MNWVLKADNPATKADEMVAIQYGAFANTVIQFLIIAFSVFIAIKFINKLSSLRDLEELKKLSALANKATDRVVGATGLVDEKKG